MVKRDKVGAAGTNPNGDHLPMNIRVRGRNTYGCEQIKAVYREMFSVNL